MDEEEYDLAAVEAQLARMQRQRQRRRLQSQPEKPRVEAAMELTEAGLSSGTDSDASGDDTSPAKPLRSAARKKNRLADSLDLSMSVADFSALVTSASNGSNQEARAPKVLGPIHDHEPSSKAVTHSDAQRALPLSDARPTSSLKPPERIQLSALKSGAMAVPRATRSVRSATDPPSTSHTTGQSGPVRCGAAVTSMGQSAPVRTGLETRATGEQQRLGKARVEAQDKNCQLRSGLEDDNNFNDEDDEDTKEDATSAEEERLRQSLEKLDSRLTRLAAAKQRAGSSNNQAAVVREGYSVAAPDTDSYHTSLKRDITRKAGDRPATVRIATTIAAKRDDDEIHSPADVDDDTIVTKAAYGGGAHCKRGQLTSAAERSSSARRAEKSSGMYKLRVRTGGAMTQESTALDKDSSKHKVVVKRDLAHLLF